MKNLLILLALLVLGTLQLFSQKETVATQDTSQYYPISFNASFLAGLPQKDFEDHNNKTGLGIGLNLFYNIENSPIHLGLKFGWMNFASTTEQRPWSMTIPDVKVDVTTDYKMYNMDLALRVMPEFGPIRPYIEAMAGFNNLSTTTTVEDINKNDEYNDIASSDDKSDWTYNYGFGGGIAFNVYRGITDEPVRRYWEFLIDLNVEYLFGGTAEYIVPNSKDIENGQSIYETAKSKTDILAFRMGVSFRF
jgi:opacity protein-like surface antigen